MTAQEKTLTFKGTERQITELLQPLSLLPTNQIDFMKKALRHNLNVLQVEENIYLNKLKEQYIEFYSTKYSREKEVIYNAMRLFCLDTQLLDFNTIEVMEYEVNNEVSQSF